MAGKLYICRGLPASGKTFWAREFVANAGFSACRINKDDLRSMTHNGNYSKEREYFITKARDVLIAQALSFGYTVVNDDTNLRNHSIEPMLTIAKLARAPVEFVLFNTPTEICIERDRLRSRTVGENVIRGMDESTETMTLEMNKYPWMYIGGNDGTTTH